MKTNIKDFSQSELEEHIIGLREPKFRAVQIYKWLYRGIDDFDCMSNVPKSLREKLKSKFVPFGLKIKKKFVSKLDGTARYLLKLNDGNYIEAVLMKYEHGYSICVSSQVGCAMGCRFCASTRNGKIRNLTMGEIVDQILAVQGDLGSRISNVVMMGVGEPLDNFENVVKFITNINNENGLNIGQRHVTLSTCGLVDKIYRLAALDLQSTLAISLHATDDEARSAIMPINKRYGIDELIKACRYYADRTRRRITFEYTMISGLNDKIADAEKLAKLLHGMLCHVNLIPVNTVEGTGFSPAGRKSVNRFLDKLNSCGVPATVRREMGSDISAACGQLRAAAEECS